jgi:magnesium transporter
MLTFIRLGSTTFEAAPHDLTGWRVPDDATWIDLCDPTREQELLVEEQLGLDVPTRDEMKELEPSSRLYQDRGATYMTAVVLINVEDPRPGSGHVSFVLTRDDKLVTLRYIEPRAFSLFHAEAVRRPICTDGARTLLGLVDAIVERSSQVLEKTASGVDAWPTRSSRPRPRTTTRPFPRSAALKPSTPTSAKVWSASPDC